MERLGLIGKPSDWLIASVYDEEAIRSRLDCELVAIPISRLTSLGEVESGEAGALRIYERLREIVDEYQLNGLTLRCFDLLSTVKNTGCLALAKLNAEGIPAACEGDVPALLTMLLAKRLTGCTGFQCNPARLNTDTGEMLWAHCTIPLNMVQTYEYDSHFESGIGIAIHAELPLGDYTIVKVSGDLKRIFAEDVQLIRNQYEPNLCRTQVWIKTQQVIPYLLKDPIANHHIIVPGHHAAEFLAECGVGGAKSGK